MGTFMDLGCDGLDTDPPSLGKIDISQSVVFSNT